MSTDGQGTKRRRKIAENYNCLTRVHERYRRQTDGRQQSRSRSLKTNSAARLEGIYSQDRDFSSRG